MQQHLEETLADEIPFMRQELSVEEQEKQWGDIRDLYGAIDLDIGDGWYQLIKDMCAEITAAYEAEGAQVDLVVDQLKEKYGTLRFYYHHKGQDAEVDAIDCLSGGSSLQTRPVSSALRQKVAQIVGNYEEKSAHICETCGKPGSLRTDLGWMLTLCDEHYSMRKRP